MEKIKYSIAKSITAFFQTHIELVTTAHTIDQQTQLSKPYTSKFILKLKSIKYILINLIHITLKLLYITQFNLKTKR